jgi:monoamine oxidase
MGTVIVVGAGFAGLTASRDLREQGHDVTVIEARDRIGGGRITGPLDRPKSRSRWVVPGSRRSTCGTSRTKSAGTRSG